MEANERLQSIRNTLDAGENAPRLSVREFLSWFGAQRRGVWIVSKIRDSLAELGIETEPDFESAYIDSEITFVGPPQAEREAQEVQEVQPEVETSAAAVMTATATASATATVSKSFDDPTHRISKLAAANRPPLSIVPDAELNEAVTKMLANDYSQLPVMTNEREVKGVISWYSIAARLALGKGGDHVREFMDAPKDIESDASLFRAIPIISEHHYVLVRTKDRRISGMVTATDLSLQFRQLSEPFLLLGEIENHIRSAIGRKLSVGELREAKNPNDDGRQVERVADLTFGEYIRLMEKTEIWEKLKLPIDRQAFCRSLDKVRLIRNDVMHFDPDGVPPDDLKILQDFASFLRRLRSIGVW